MTFMTSYHPRDLPPEIRAAVRQVASNSARRKTWFVSIRDSVKIQRCYWDGGSKRAYSAVTTTGSPVTLPEASAPEGHFSSPRSWIEPEYQIPEGVVVVIHGTSCGKSAFPHIMISPALAEKILS